MIERLRLLLIKLALSSAVLTLLVLGVVLLSVQLYVFIRWNFAEIVEVVSGTGSIAIALYITLGLSCALVLFSIVGLCGVCRRSFGCLSTFALFLGLSIVLLVALVGCFFAYRDVVDEHGKTEMMDSMINYYQGKLKSLFQVLGVVLLSVQLYVFIRWNFAEIVEVVSGTGSIAIALYITLGLSCALVLFSLVGLCGVCRRSFGCLSTFALFLGLSIVLLVALVGCFFAYRDVVDEHGKTEMMDSMINYYQGEAGQDPVSIGWNLLQYSLQCCGVEGPGDWNQTNWYATDPQVQELDQKWPFTCCKLERSGVSEKKLADGEVSGDTIAQTDASECHLMDTPGLYHKGCKDELFRLLDKSIYVTAGVAIGTILVMLGLLWMTCQLIHDADEKEKLENEEEKCEQ
ncbi:tetraspanin-18-like [Symsagittifera roscoffensis]|uniref:tetraspanin-18-like n=1 Tax=Symsagittifera roscoffensis TaxID=84072 RepID=UPI00307C7812